MGRPVVGVSRDARLRPRSGGYILSLRTFSRQQADFQPGQLSELTTPSTISIDSVVAVAADQISCDLDGEAAILNLKSGAYHGLDPVGATVWSLLATPTTVRAIADLMIDRYEVDRARCERDLIELLGKLAERGLIEVSDGRAG